MILARSLIRINLKVAYFDAGTISRCKFLRLPESMMNLYTLVYVNINKCARNTSVKNRGEAQIQGKGSFAAILKNDHHDLRKLFTFRVKI